MTSKEALENLVYCKSITKCKECKHKNRCTMEKDYNTIKQDLEHKEELSQEYNTLKKEYDELDLKIIDLEKENQELKEQHEKDFEIICKQAYLLNSKHIDRPFIEKYQKAIEILKKYTHIDKNGDGFTITIWFNTENCDFKSCPTLEECIFIKEVLGD